LTRRANHRYIDNIARISKPAPENWQRVFPLAGARERAGMRRGLSTFARGPRSDDLQSRCERRSAIALGIGFAPEMIAQAIMPHILFIPDEEAGMTAYLISLALTGLILIVLWEGLS
jgi:hypothetical protein